VEFDLSMVLTAAGMTASAALIASFIEIAKHTAFFGAWLDAQRESSVAVILAALLVGYAAFATHQVIDPGSVFADFLVWIGLAKLTAAAYDSGSNAVTAAKVLVTKAQG